MSFNLSGLSAYTDQLSTDLISRAILKPQTVNNLTVRAGVTAGTTAINILGNTVDITDASCGFGSGAVGNNATVFTQINAVTASKQLKEILCTQTLVDYWTSSQLSASANLTEVPFEQAIADLKVKEIGKYVEQTLWAGDGSRLAGLKHQLSVAEGAVDGTDYSAKWTASNAVANMWGMIDLIPTAVKQNDDLVAFVSYATYSKIVQGLQDKGNSILLQYPHIENVTGQAESSFVFPGSNVRVFAAPGLVDDANESTVFVGPKQYVFMTTGLVNDESAFKFGYTPVLDEVHFVAKFKLGTAALADQFVSTKA